MTTRSKRYSDIAERRIVEIVHQAAHAGGSTGRRIGHGDGNSLGRAIHSSGGGESELISSYLGRAWAESEYTRGGVECRVGHQRQRRDIETHHWTGTARGGYGKSESLTEIDDLVTDWVENQSGTNDRRSLRNCAGTKWIGHGQSNGVGAGRAVGMSRTRAAACAAVAKSPCERDGIAIRIVARASELNRHADRACVRTAGVGRGRMVYLNHGDGDRGGRARNWAVAGAEGKTVRTEIIGGRSVADCRGAGRSLALDRAIGRADVAKGPMVRRRGNMEAQRAAIDIAGSQSDSDRRVFIRASRLGQRDRRIVDRGDVDIHRRHVAVVRTIEDPVAKTIGAIEIVLRRVMERAVGVERKRHCAGRTAHK